MTRSLLSLCALLLTGCNLPGRPRPGPEVPRPEAVMGFDELYGENCAGCHGVNGRNGPATNLANPEYQAYVDDASLRDAIAKGEKGSLMPAFAISSGGNLTGAQVNALVTGMRQRWSKPGQFAAGSMPAYKPAQAGHPENGQAVYATACAQCHGATAQQPGPAGSVLDGSFLALVNEQTLRTTIVAGRPDIGQPDWRNQISGRPLTDAEITDVSQWMIAQTPAHPGRPYPNGRPASGNSGSAQPSPVSALR